MNAEALRKIEFGETNCNLPDDVIMEQTAFNIRRQLTQASPHHVNHETVALVCGGPSLNQTKHELVRASWKGEKVVAVNGAYRWCIEHNIRPSAMIMLDAREFNARFVEWDVPDCRYLLASQCHPRAFDLCADRSVHIWHACSAGDPELEMISKYYFKRVVPVTMGTTVAIRAISLLRMLGFRSFDIFGLDSCWTDTEHHAYEQKENDRDGRIEVWLRPEDHPELNRKFICAPWMVKQAYDIQELIREKGNEFRLNVRGDGLIAHIMRTGALLEKE